MIETGSFQLRNPEEFLASLGPKARGRLRRLLMCGYCRRLWKQIESEEAKQAIEAAERYADYQIGYFDFLELRKPYLEQQIKITPTGEKFQLTEFVSAACSLSLIHLPPNRTKGTDTLLMPLIQDIFEDFQNSLTILNEWCSTNVVDLARTIYEERAFDRMPFLADALMDEGCQSDAVIEHCKSSSPHVRGCWVLDQILSLRQIPSNELMGD
jgi:hypothetical protein